MYLRRWKSFFTALFTTGRAVDRALYRCVYRGDRTYGCGDTAFSVGDHRQSWCFTNSLGIKGLKSAQPQMILLKAFSHDLRKNNGQNRIRTTWKTHSALASSQFKMTVLPVVTGFLYRLRTQTIIRQKVYSFQMETDELQPCSFAIMVSISRQLWRNAGGCYLWERIWNKGTVH